MVPRVAACLLTADMGKARPACQLVKGKPSRARRRHRCILVARTGFFRVRVVLVFTTGKTVMHKLSGSISRVLAALLLGVLTLSAQAKQPPSEDWIQHYPKSVIGADGKQHAPTCSGYPGTNSKFSFWTKKGSSKNVAVYFEGGGACWNDATCSFPFDNRLPADSPIPQFFVPAIEPGSTPPGYSGIFDAKNPANPVRDWSIVYIPYCTGDLHAGSTTQTYYNANPYNPSLPPSFKIEHRGFDNFMVVLDWMTKNIEKPKKVLVTGSSAGGYGATANFPWIENSFRNAHTYVIADASQGVTVPTFDTVGRTSWNLQLAPWVFGNNPSSIAGPDLLRVAAKALPRVKTAQFTTAYDGTQIGFYAAMTYFYGERGVCAAASADPSSVVVDWHNKMVTTLQSYAADVGNYRYYLADGSYHTLLRSPTFFTESSAGVNFSEWVEDMLSNRGGTNGKGGDWENVACETCLFQPPCP